MGDGDYIMVEVNHSDAVEPDDPDDYVADGTTSTGSGSHVRVPISTADARVSSPASLPHGRARTPPIEWCAIDVI